MKYLLVIAMIALSACEPDDHCNVSDTRCSGPFPQVCNSDSLWVDIMSCDKVAEQSGGRWSCQSLENDAGHTCLPVTEDGGSDGGSHD